MELQGTPRNSDKKVYSLVTNLSYYQEYNSMLLEAFIDRFTYMKGNEIVKNKGLTLLNESTHQNADGRLS